jgi:hypothetical protein
MDGVLRDKAMACTLRMPPDLWAKLGTMPNADATGHETYTKGQRRYRRRLGTAEPDETPSGYIAGFTGVKRTRQPSPLVDSDPGERIKDMDHEGVDVNLTLPSGWFGTWTAGDDVALEMAMYRAYHRWMADYS